MFYIGSPYHFVFIELLLQALRWFEDAEQSKCSLNVMFKLVIRLL